MSMLNVAVIIAVCVLTKSLISNYLLTLLVTLTLSFHFFFIHQFIYYPTLTLRSTPLPSPHTFPLHTAVLKQTDPLLYSFIVNDSISYLTLAHIVYISYIDILGITKTRYTRTKAATGEISTDVS